MSTILQGRPNVHSAHKKSSSGFRQKYPHTFNDDVTVLAECRALHGEGQGGPGTGLENGRDEKRNEKGERGEMDAIPAQRFDCAAHRQT